MPLLHQNNEEWIYNAICENKFNYDDDTNLYKYSNPEFPNKNYKKTFDPKSFMHRGDVIHFGNEYYRNNNKMIFDGLQLLTLYDKIDDYGSVPPEFVCGDKPGEFNIGDFEDIVDHNTINWLSIEKLKEIEFYIEDDKIKGKVMIKGKLWKIKIDLSCHDESEFTIGWWGSKKYTCNIIDNNIKINKKNDYLIKALNEDDTHNLNTMIKEHNPISIIHGKAWFAYHIINEINVNDMVKEPNLPVILKNITSYYTNEKLINNLEEFNNYKIKKKDLDKTYIQEIIGYPITIELIKKDIETRLNFVKDHINKIIIDYDSINQEQPFYKINDNTLEIYI